MDYDGDFFVFEDNNGYGIYVSGIIVVVFNNEGVVGVVFKVKILSLKVFIGEGLGNYEWIIDVINYVVEWCGFNNE